MKKIFYSIIQLLFALNLAAQGRPYLEEITTSIEVSYDHIYGENATILYFPYYGEAIKEPLFFDLYKPVKDDPQCNGGLRPLIIYFHSGNFLPFPQNRNTVGTRTDSSVVTMCKRLAKTGYVVASADYRLGWDPVANSVDARKLGLINAAYRGVQDANTCIRYFKKSVAEDGNPFQIDTSRIILWGDDSGSYIALHAGCLDRYDKIPSASDGKFLLGGLLPMVLEYLNGDVEAKNFGVNTPQAAHLPFPAGDTLCYANYPEYSSEFRATVNLSGAVGDTAWIDPGQPPVISVHTPNDLTTPCEEGIVYVHIPPDTYLEVVEVQGSCVISPMENSYGNNACLNSLDPLSEFEQSVTEVANNRSGGVENLLLLLGDTITDGTPWNFWNTDGPEKNENSEIGLSTNPYMSREKAEKYMDTILAYVLPRLYQCMDLCITATNNPTDPNSIDIITYPNPAYQEVFIATSKDHPMRKISVYDMTGSLVSSYGAINFNYFHLPVEKLPPGQYVLKFQFDHSITSRQIIVK